MYNVCCVYFGVHSINWKKFYEFAKSPQNLKVAHPLNQITVKFLSFASLMKQSEKFNPLKT